MQDVRETKRWRKNSKEEMRTGVGEAARRRRRRRRRRRKIGLKGKHLRLGRKRERPGLFSLWCGKEL